MLLTLKFRPFGPSIGNQFGEGVRHTVDLKNAPVLRGVATILG